MIRQSDSFPFERIACEYARWSALADWQRPPAPGWWWSPAFALRDSTDVLPKNASAALQLADGASYADGARRLLAALAGQTFLPWPSDLLLHEEAPPADQDAARPD